jgi:hypothetical protein
MDLGDTTYKVYGLKNALSEFVDLTSHYKLMDL